MAETAYEFVTGRQGVAAMVVVAGKGHVQYGWGIPSRIERRICGGEPGCERGREQVVTVIPATLGREDVTRQKFEQWRSERYADFVWVGPPPE
jgi:hypothetical protein